MLLVVSPNLAMDRVLEVDSFAAAKVQRSRSVLTQPGGKGSNVARVFRQLGGDVVLVGFVGRGNARLVIEPLRAIGIRVDAVRAYDGESRTCTIICDPKTESHPTVINEESPHIEPAAARQLLTTIDKWIPRVDGVLTTGSLSMGLPEELYAAVLDRARRKITAIDAAGEVLRVGLLARPQFMKPNTSEFFQLRDSSSLSILAPHTALTFGNAGALLVHREACLYALPPRISHTNPIGAGDAFTAGYLKGLLDRRSYRECFRLAMAAASNDAATLRPGFVELHEVERLAAEVELRFLFPHAFPG